MLECLQLKCPLCAVRILRKKSVINKDEVQLALLGLTTGTRTEKCARGVRGETFQDFRGFCVFG